MPKHLDQNNFFSIHEAARILGVATKTLRRWEEAGVLIPERTSGGHRRYSLTQLKNIQRKRADKKSRINVNSLYDINLNSEIFQEPTFQSEIPELYRELHFSQKKALAVVYIGLMAIFGTFLFSRLALPILKPDIKLISQTTSLTKILPPFLTAPAAQPKANYSASYESAKVLAAEATNLNNAVFTVNVDSVLTNLTAKGDVTGDKTLTINGNTTLKGISNDIAGTLNLSGNTLTSTTDLTINPKGGGAKIGTETPTSIDMAGGDLFVSGDLEIRGTSYLPTLTIGGDTFTDLTGTGLQVSNGELQTTLGTTIDSSEISDDTIKEIDLNVSNSPIAGYLLTYNSGTGGFTWVSQSSITGSNYWQETTGSLAPYNETLALNIGATASASAYFHVPGNNNANAWFNLGTGNLGIGTTTPSAALDVAGNLLVNGGGAIDTRVAGTLTIGGTTQTGLTLGNSGATTTIAGLSVLISPLITNGVIYTSNGNGTLNSEAQLAIARGGTNSTATPTQGGLTYGTGTAYAFTSAGSAGQILSSNGTGAPSWVDSGTIGVNYWTLDTNSLSPENPTYAFNIGATASESAYFHAPGTTNQDAWFNLGTGGLGIGTTEPLAALDVAGNLLVNAGGTIDARSAGSLTLGGTTQSSLTLGRAGANTSLYGTNITEGGLAYGGATNILSFTSALTGILKANNTSAPTVLTSTTDYVTYWSNSYTISGEQFLATSRGGLGANATAADTGELLYSTATTAYGHLGVGTSNQVLHSGATPSWGAVSLTADVSGTLPIANGGTNSTATPTQGGIAYGTGTAYAFSLAGSGGQILTSGGTGTPTWTDPGSVGTNYWQLTSASLAPYNETLALNIGSTASSSAFFHAPGTNNDNAWFNLGTGKVGIGTTIPGQTLTVEGSLGILEGGTSPSYHTIIQGGDQGGNITYTLPVSQGATNSVLTNDGAGALSWMPSEGGGGTIGFWTRSGTTLVPANAGDTVATTGNVGVGTTTPATLLDVSSLFNVTASGKVGIGVTNPATALDVTGTGRFSTGLTLTTGALNLTATSGTLSLTGLSASSISTGANGLTLASGGTSSWTNTSGDLTLSTASSGTLAITSAGALNLTSAAASSWDLAGSTVNALSFETNLLSLDTSGSRVGIGTTNPGATLDVAGNLLVKNGGTIDTRAAGSLTIGGTNQDALNLGRSGTTTSLIGSNITLGGLAYGGADNTLSFTSALTGMLKANDASAPLVVTSSQDYVTYWSDANTISGEQYLATSRGGLGADVTAAGAGEIIYSTATTTYGHLAAGDAGQILTSGGTSAPVWVNSSTLASNYWQITSASLAPYNETLALNVGSTASSSAFFHAPGTNNNNAWFNLGTGNVGVGTTIPAAPLSVGSTSQFQVSSTGAVTAVGVNAGAGLLQGALGLTITGATASLNASSNFATNINTGTSTGGVSIGNSAAGALTLASDANSSFTVTTGDLTFSTVTSGTLALTSAGALNLTSGAASSWTLPASTVNALSFQTDLLSLDSSNSRVGIGTTSPKAKLSVVGGVGIGTTDSFANAAIAANNLAVQGKIGVGVTNPGDSIEVSSGSLRLDALSASGAVYTDSNKSLTSSAPTSGTLGFWQRNSTTLTPATSTDNLTIGSTTNTAAMLYVPGATNQNAWFNLGTGKLGIGTTVPAATFQVNATGSNPFVVNSSGNVGIGTTAPSATLDLTTAVSTGYGFNLTANSLTSGSAMYLSSTATGLTGNLMKLYLNPASASTITGDILRIDSGSNLTLSGYYLNITNNGSAVFQVGQNQITSAVPQQFTAAGDVSVAYDINFTNPTASYIKSAAPLYLQAGEAFNSSNLTLRTYNSGQVVIDGTLNGTTVVSNTTSTGAGTVTVSSRGVSYYLHDSSGTTDSSYTTTINVTGVPDTEGAIVFIRSGCQKGATSGSRTHTCAIQINGTQVSSVATATGTGASTVLENYIIARLNGSWRIVTGTGTADSADLAELYKAELDVDAAEVVSLESNDQLKIRRAKTGDNALVIGVTSTKPAILMGEEFDNDTHKIAVALSGRVPVKITRQSTPIALGDFLTASGEPGRAMKAEVDGYVIGKALEAWDCSDPGNTTLCKDKILVALNQSVNVNTMLAEQQTANSKNTPEIASESATLTDRVTNLETELTLLQSQLSLSANNLSLTASSSATFDKLTTTDLTVVNKATLPDTVVAGGLTIGLMSIDNINSSIDVAGTLKLQPMAYGGIDILNGLVTIDTNGNLTTKEVTAEKYRVAGASAGSGTLPANTKTVFVATSLTSVNSLIFITPKTAGASPLAVTGKTDGLGFTVEIGTTISKAIDFDWWIVEKK